MLDINAPIVPWSGMGNIKLYSKIHDLKKIIKAEKTKAYLYDNFLIRYEIEGKMYLFFNLLNGKLFKMTTLKEYKGRLFDKIYVGISTDEMLKIEPSFEYDEFEEVYVSNKGIFIETDPETNTVQWISIFIKELETDSFEEANW